MLYYEGLWVPKSLGDEVHSYEGIMESQGMQLLFYCHTALIIMDVSPLTTMCMA